MKLKQGLQPPCAITLQLWQNYVAIKNQLVYD